MYLNTCISITCISITPTLLIIIRLYCGKQCELLLNRFLIKDIHHVLNLLRHLPLSSIIDDKNSIPSFFSTPCGKKFRPPPSSLDPPLHFDNSITGNSQSSGEGKLVLCVKDDFFREPVGPIRSRRQIGRAS